MRLELLAVFSVVLALPSAHAEKGVGNGGDFARKGFLDAGQALLVDLKTTPEGKALTQSMGIDVDRMEKMLNIDFVKTTDQTIKDNGGSVVDAVSSPAGILLSKQGWSIFMGSDNLVDLKWMVFHELLRAQPIDDDNFIVSRKLYSKVGTPPAATASGSGLCNRPDGKKGRFCSLEQEFQRGVYPGFLKASHRAVLAGRCYYTDAPETGVASMLSVWETTKDGPAFAERKMWAIDCEDCDEASFDTLVEDDRSRLISAQSDAEDSIRFQDVPGQKIVSDLKDEGIRLTAVAGGPDSHSRISIHGDDRVFPTAKSIFVKAERDNQTVGYCYYFNQVDP